MQCKREQSHDEASHDTANRICKKKGIVMKGHAKKMKWNCMYYKTNLIGWWALQLEWKRKKEKRLGNVWHLGTPDFQSCLLCSYFWASRQFRLWETSRRCVKAQGHLTLCDQANQIPTLGFGPSGEPVDMWDAKMESLSQSQNYPPTK